MTETKDTTDKTLRAGARKPLSLQRTVESGHVRQNFSHGRSKSVVVEKRKTRKLGGSGGAEPEVASCSSRLRACRCTQARAAAGDAACGRQGQVRQAAVSPTRNATHAHAHLPPRASATTSSASRNSPAPSVKPQPPPPRRRLPSPRRRRRRGDRTCCRARTGSARAFAFIDAFVGPPAAFQRRAAPERRWRASAHVLQSGAAAA